MGIKKCPKCSEVKEHSLFYRNSSAKDNCSPYCKVCSNFRTTSYAKENKDKIQPKLVGYALKRRYGISVNDYEELLKLQDFKCKICGTDKCKSGRNFAVDHDHITGRVRGLLCSACNQGLGNFKDSPELLQKAIKYLNENFRH
jgi:hypothetical protein